MKRTLKQTLLISVAAIALVAGANLADAQRGDRGPMPQAAPAETTSPTAARIAPVPGHSPSGIGIVGCRSTGGGTGWNCSGTCSGESGIGAGRGSPGSSIGC